MVARSILHPQCIAVLRVNYAISKRSQKHEYLVRFHMITSRIFYIYLIREQYRIQICNVSRCWNIPCMINLLFLVSIINNTIWCVSVSKGCVYQYHRHRFPIVTHFQMRLLPSVCMRSLIGFQLVDKSSLGNHWKAATGPSSDQYLETGRVTQVIQSLR